MAEALLLFGVYAMHCFSYDEKRLVFKVLDNIHDQETRISIISCLANTFRCKMTDIEDLLYYENLNNKKAGKSC